MKTKIKRFLPKWLFNFLRKKRDKYRLRKKYKIDQKRFENSAFGIDKKKNKENLEAMITFHYHALEKALSFLDFKSGKALSSYDKLIAAMHEYRDKGFDLTIKAYVSALSVIDAYIKKEEEYGLDVTKLKNELTNLSKDIEFSNEGGIYELTKKDLLRTKDSNFKELAFNRVSVRDFDEEPVKKEQIEEALSIAEKTPSVCNRQGYNVYAISNKETIQKLLKIQGGLTGHANNISYLLLVTGNNNYMNNWHERNQAFIDGGLYAMSLIYALEYVGVGACPIHAFFDGPARKLLNIPDSRNLILYIAVGNYPEKVKVPKSPRESFKRKTTFIE